MLLNYLPAFLRCYIFLTALKNFYPIKSNLFFASIFSLLVTQNIDSINFGILITNSIIGYILVLPLLVLISIASNIGEILDSARGQSIGYLIDPTTKQESSSLGFLFKTIYQYLFLISGLLPFLVFVLLKSLKAMPLEISINDLISLNLINRLTIIFGAYNKAFWLLLPILAFYTLLEICNIWILKLHPKLNSLNQEMFLLKTSFLIFLLMSIREIDYKFFLVNFLTNFYQNTFIMY